MNLRIKISFAVFVLMLLHTTLAEATNGMKVIGVGPVQRAMGGAAVGMPLDAATTITNPAGMSQIEKQMNFGITYFAPDVSYSANSTSGQVAVNNKIIESDSQPFVIPAFGIVWYKDDHITLGVGAYGVSGMGVDYESNLYNNITYTEYTFMKFAPALAYSVNDQLSIGIAPNINYAGMDYEAGTTAEVAHHGGKSYGLGFTLGAYYQATHVVSLGLAYESKQSFPDFEFNTTSGRDKLDFDQPQNITAGVGLRLNDKLRLAFDLVWIDWPQSNGANKPAYTQNSSGATAWNMNWSEQFVYKVGMEYDINDKVTVRAGYNYGRNPLDANQPFESISFPAIAEHHITFGAGYRFSDKLEFNLGLMVAPEVSFDSANAAGQFIDDSTTKMSQFAIDAGITYRF